MAPQEILNMKQEISHLKQEKDAKIQEKDAEIARLRQALADKLKSNFHY